MHVNIRPPTFSAGEPYTVPSSTPGSVRPISRTVSNVIFFRRMNANSFGTLPGAEHLERIEFGCAPCGYEAGNDGHQHEDDRHDDKA